MDTNKIDVLLKAVENGSLLTTAGQLGYTQAGLTHMMKSLETELGITLLVRGKFGIRLTEEGQRLLPLFENLVSANEKIIREAELIRQQNNSVIRLAAVASVIRTWLPDVISAFQKQHPEYAFELKEGDFSIYKWFDQGRVDLCITCNILNRRDFEPLMTDEFFACLPPDYPIGENEVFPIKRFEDESYISATCGEDYDIQELLDEYDVHPKKQNTRVDDASVISMVSKGLGVSLIPKLVLDSSRADIKAVPLDMPCTRRIGIIHGKSKDMSPGMKLFIKFLKQWFQND
ncbi:LysR family transcriptional regulator [Ihubacter sp. rT4E-8]|uniref:LysR family transcriptional regulator n=1 Tax=Ihubacter sp. rT4E-8 TaxID=3242369 RepID=UPI003CEE36BA